jgi:hypothetical protein
MPCKERDFAERQGWDLWERVKKLPLDSPCIDAICRSITRAQHKIPAQIQVLEVMSAPAYNQNLVSSISLKSPVTKPLKCFLINVMISSYEYKTVVKPGCFRHGLTVLHCASWIERH